MIAASERRGSVGSRSLPNLIGCDFDEVVCPVNNKYFYDGPWFALVAASGAVFLICSCLSQDSCSLAANLTARARCRRDEISLRMSWRVVARGAIDNGLWHVCRGHESESYTVSVDKRRVYVDKVPQFAETLVL